MCAARFKDDGCWYRTKLLGPTAGKQGKSYDVLFIDFGNKSTVNIDTDTRKLPAHLLAFEPQAMIGYLAYIQVPRMNKSMGKEALEYVKKQGLNKKQDAIVVE